MKMDKVLLKDLKRYWMIQEMQNIQRKPNKIWVDHGSEFYNNKFKVFFKKKMTLKRIQLLMKENQLLQKDLSRL